MSIRLSTGRVRATYEFIKAHRHEYGVRTMCHLLEIAPSGYYDWLKKPTSARAKEDARLLQLIRASFIASQGVYGAPRVFLDLREAGETCSSIALHASCGPTACAPFIVIARGVGRSESRHS